MTPTSTHPARSHYFFIRKAKEGEEWEFPTIFQRMTTPSIQWSRSVEGDEFYGAVQKFIRDMYGGNSVPVSTICTDDYMVRAGISRLAPSPIGEAVGEVHEVEPSGSTSEGSRPYSQVCSAIGSRA